MIRVTIAINGDNEGLVRRQLADALPHFAIAEESQTSAVYRAWTERVDRHDLDDEMAGPTELPLA